LCCDLRQHRRRRDARGTSAVHRAAELVDPGPLRGDPAVHLRLWIGAAAALEEFEPELLEIPGEACGQQPFPLVSGGEPIGGGLRPVQPERFAELGVGAGQQDRILAERCASAATPTAPFSSNSRTIFVIRCSGAPG
jgi:hypothetical protein